MDQLPPAPKAYRSIIMQHSIFKEKVMHYCVLGVGTGVCVCVYLHMYMFMFMCIRIRMCEYECVCSSAGLLPS